jgi:hypothetical protein
VRQLPAEPSTNEDLLWSKDVRSGYKPIYFRAVPETAEFNDRITASVVSECGEEFPNFQPCNTEAHQVLVRDTPRPWLSKLSASLLVELIENAGKIIAPVSASSL